MSSETNANTCDIRSLRPIYAHLRPSFQPRGQMRQRGVEIAWGFQIACRHEGSGPPRIRVSGWALSPDTATPAQVIRFREPSGQDHDFHPDRRRLDVLRALGLDATIKDPVAQCGILGEFETRATRLSVRISTGEQEFDIGTVEVKPQEVLAGQDGWLFLTGDTNDSLTQHCRDYRPASDWLAAWDRYFAAVETQPVGKTVFVVAPAKESVMPDRHPVPVRAKGPITHLLSRHPGHIIYPVEKLGEARDLAYDRVDTHWTDFGGRIAAEQVLQEAGEELPPIPDLYHIATGRGDLGDKLAPPETALRASAAWPDASLCVFENFVTHHGNIRIFRNDQAPLDRTVLLFGGSSANYMIRYLATACRRLVSVWSTGVWDDEIIAHERPDIVILQTNERFLVTPPAPRMNTFSMVARKIARGQTTPPPDVAAVMAGFAEAGEGWYVSRHPRQS